MKTVKKYSVLIHHHYAETSSQKVLATGEEEAKAIAEYAFREQADDHVIITSVEIGEHAL